MKLTRLLAAVLALAALANLSVAAGHKSDVGSSGCDGGGTRPPSDPPQAP